MAHLKLKKLCFFLLIILTLSILFSTSASAISDGATEAFVNTDEEPLQSQTAGKEGIRVSSRIYELLFGKSKDKKSISLIPGGDVFGIRIKEEYITVAKANEGSALRRGDKIIKINGEEIYEIGDVSAILKDSHGSALKLEILRSGEKMTLTTIPKLEDGEYKLGVTLRNVACGIGTVTFIDPETSAFGGLGHGVFEPESTKLVGVKAGESTDVILGSIKRGESGKPGELSGVLNKNVTGTIEKNTDCGVFGIFNSTDMAMSAAIPVGFKEEVKLGEAEIISTVRSGKKSTYKIEITEIDADAKGSKCFKIKVTDPVLIALTGGIVRGMSGSPIIQDGKFVGAVTHVMVADPTEGYGIFIENMLASVPKALPNAA